MLIIDHAAAVFLQPLRWMPVRIAVALMLPLMLNLSMGVSHGGPTTRQFMAASDGTWLQISAEAPSARWGHTTILDPTRDAVFLFGGSGSLQAFNDVWRHDFDSSTWMLVPVNGTPPFRRYEHSSVLDILRDRMLVFGGTDLSFSVNNEIWELDLVTSTWTRLLPAGGQPSARHGATMIYDSQRDRVLLYGGYDNVNVLTDVWELSLTSPPAWQLLQTSGGPPSGRAEHSAIYDPQDDAMVVMGGGGGPAGTTSDVWKLSLDTSTWTLVSASPGPPARAGHTAVLDSYENRMVVYGGYNGQSGMYLNDVWALDLAGPHDWTELSPSGQIPDPRDGHAAVYDPSRNQMFVFGGFSDTEIFNETWHLQWASLSSVPNNGKRTMTLSPPFPNPNLAGSVQVSFEAERTEIVSITVFDLAGRLIRRLVTESEVNPGRHDVAWDGRDDSGGAVSSGVYLIRMFSEGKSRGSVQVTLIR